MFKTLLSLLFLFSFQSLSTPHSIFPDNDLWKQDPQYVQKQCDNNIMPNAMLWQCFLKPIEQGISKEVFEKIIDTAFEIYKPLADTNEETLVIQKYWDSSTVNASSSRMWGTVEIEMYGGLARRKEISTEGFIMIICHELGHAYGGKPQIKKLDHMSVEGQADYSSSACAVKLMEKMGLVKAEQTPTEFMTASCADYNGTKDLCIATLVGGQEIGTLLSVVYETAVPNYETPDNTVVEDTLESYPENIQCRLDSYYNGVLNKDRPLCWYKPNNN